MLCKAVINCFSYGYSWLWNMAVLSVCSLVWGVSTLGSEHHGAAAIAAKPAPMFTESD
jgi:hypothetical protein